MVEEKRRFTRIPFQVKTEMTVNNVLYSSEKINNLSVGGCSLPIEANVATGTKCHLDILLSGTTSKLSVHIDGKIIRCELGAVIIEFTEIETDSLFYLQNIVRHNCADIEKVEQEIRNHPGLG